jgi:hypothetical protein
MHEHQYQSGKQNVNQFFVHHLAAKNRDGGK